MDNKTTAIFKGAFIILAAACMFLAVFGHLIPFFGTVTIFERVCMVLLGFIFAAISAIGNF